MTFLARSSLPDFATSGTQDKTEADESEQRQIPGATTDHRTGMAPVLFRRFTVKIAGCCWPPRSVRNERGASLRRIARELSGSREL